MRNRGVGWVANERYWSLTVLIDVLLSFDLSAIYSVFTFPVL
jgi:hypothetical protein